MIFVPIIHQLGTNYILRLPTEVFEAFEELNSEVNNEDLAYNARQKSRGYRGYLEKMLQLSCFGYNSGMLLNGTRFGYDLVPIFISGRFDSHCLLHGIMKWKTLHNYNAETIMKGNSFVLIKMSSPDSRTIIGFKDVLQYTVPCPLSKFLKQWKIPEAKGIFPHG